VIALDMETDRYEVHIVNGKVAQIRRVESLDGTYDIRVGAPAEAWSKLLEAIPPPRYDDIRFGGLSVGFTVDGDLVGAVGPYYGAPPGLWWPSCAGPAVGIGRAGRSPMSSACSTRLSGAMCTYGGWRAVPRLFREAGSGSIPMVLQHTAGADGRQWRHVLEDETTSATTA